MFCPEGVKKGDRVSIYMPMVVELVVAMLACARIGAVHSIVVCPSCITLRMIPSDVIIRDATVQCKILNHSVHPARSNMPLWIVGFWFCDSF